jgi:predicted metalloprotease with PDZ domain
MIARTVQEDRQRPGNRIQPVAEASFDSWVKGRGNQQSYNAESDFYGKGSTVSMVLDLEIRQRSENKYSLDDVMRALYKRFPLSGGVGYTNEDLQSVAEKLAGSSLAKIFEDYVYGAAPVDWERLLLYAGLELRAKDAERRPDLGLMAFDRDGKLRVVRVLAGSAAEDAGIDIGDEIVAFNGGRVTQARDLTDRLADLKAGDKVRLTFFRRDRLKDVDIPLRLQSVPAYSVSKTANPTPLQKSIYESWLRATW